MILCLRPSWTAVCHYSYFIADKCPRLSTSHLTIISWFYSALSFYLRPYLHFSLISSPLFVCLSRGSAPRLSQHQRVSLCAGLRRVLGDWPPLQLVPRERRHHQGCGQGLHWWNNIVCNHGSHVWPLHLLGYQQERPQFCHLYCRFELTLNYLFVPLHEAVNIVLFSTPPLKLQ